MLHRGSGAVVFSDASGFTALTERLALKTNGAELLSQCLTSFFTPLIQFLGQSHSFKNADLDAFLIICESFDMGVASIGDFGVIVFNGECTMNLCMRPTRLQSELAVRHPGLLMRIEVMSSSSAVML